MGKDETKKILSEYNITTYLTARDEVILASILMLHKKLTDIEALLRNG